MIDNLIIANKVNYIYRSHAEGAFGTQALSDMSAEIKEGQFVVVIGRNGSGKSTFARLLNALIIPTNGEVYISGLITSDEKNIWKIRKSAGMVFQNPDNQIIGTTVEEDVAFGPENLGVPPEEIRTRVEAALKSVGILEYSKNAPHLLSGGQKQRVAIAGILAMRPKCIILDEATSMLDPIGRKEVMEILWKLNREDGITVIHITHHMEEAVNADRVIVVDAGKAVLDGSPREVFSNVDRIKGLGMDVPQVSEILHGLKSIGYDLRTDILSVDEAFEELSLLISQD